MREIREVIFRGKRTDCEAWVEGDLLHYESGEMAICKGFSNYGYEATEIIGRYKVIPETVGQYTGLTDKNGVRIFEGDICRFKRFNDIYIGKIVFNVKTASFVMWYQSIVGAYGEKATHKMLLSVCDGIEVIGNIYDNPELLGGENNGSK